jgi:hypothetical protein
MDDLKPGCFPECGKWLAQRLDAPSPLPVLVPSGFYDGALWRSWPPTGLPVVADGVEETSGFRAIEQVMRLHHMRVAAHACACPSGGSSIQMYRAFGIELSKAESEVSPC